MTDTEESRASLAIGEFSSRTRISVRMLRHYDEHGLLTPAEVDPVTGYRRYAPAQLADALRIRRLRDVGFSVSAMSAVLAARDTGAYRRALTLQRESLARDLRAASDRIVLIDHLLDSEGATMPDIIVSRTTVPARTVVALRGTVPTYADEGELWARLVPELDRQGITPIGPGGVIEHDGEYRETDPDESVWLPVAAGTTAEAPLEVLDLPERDVVMARLEGPYSLISEAHVRIGEFAAAEGIQLASGGPEAPIADRNFNRYLTTPENTPSDKLVSEVCMPVA